MEQKSSLTIELGRLDSEDINLFCKTNEITDVNGFIQLCLRKGYYIEKYGLLNQGTLPDVIEREFEREVKVEDTSKIEELQNEIYILKGKLENQKEEFFGAERLVKLVHNYYPLKMEDMNNLIFSKLDEWRGELNLVDDTAIFICRFF